MEGRLGRILGEAAALHDTGDYDGAVRLYDEALGLRPGDPGIEASRRLSKLRSVKYWWGRYAGRGGPARSGRDDTAAFAEIGHALYGIKYYAEAAECFAEAAGADPGDHLHPLHRGRALADLGRHAEAVGCFDGALALRPGGLRALECKAASLRELGRHAEAVACLDAVISAKPDYHWAYLEKAASLAELGRIPEALGCHDEAIRARPEGGMSELKGDLLASLGRRREAAECYAESLRFLDEEIAADPDDEELFFERARLLDKAGRRKQATKCYDWAFYLEGQGGPTCCPRDGEVAADRLREHGVHYAVREPGLFYARADADCPAPEYPLGRPDPAMILALIDAPRIGDFYKKSAFARNRAW